MSGEKRSRVEKEQAEIDTATQRTAELALEKHNPMEQEQTLQEGSREFVSIEALGQKEGKQKEAGRKGYHEHRDSYFT